MSERYYDNVRPFISLQALSDDGTVIMGPARPREPDNDAAQLPYCGLFKCLLLIHRLLNSRISGRAAASSATRAARRQILAELCRSPGVSPRWLPLLLFPPPPPPSSSSAAPPPARTGSGVHTVHLLPSSKSRNHWERWRTSAMNLSPILISPWKVPAGETRLYGAGFRSTHPLRLPSPMTPPR